LISLKSRGFLFAATKTKGLLFRNPRGVHANLAARADWAGRQPGR